ncbi:alpha,alpha-trehalase TreF [Pontibacter sp. G13]|uniref:alpha,alpha-trehalase TreF n=1 Tax=Pontibacter sp. G13 TaxID=3074898 RepID=UPI00288C6009|nr:alpha,alpha-trehalase TreF [Pontibacter sp. G13]WNJ18480.1 alpha,alpha-trehalase TreF [Pontibacter sp. G13]
MLDLNATAIRFFLLVSIILTSCREPNRPETFDFYQSECFREVQLSGLFSDSKTFADMDPRLPLAEINEIYETKKNQPGFVLDSFVTEYFEMPVSPTSNFVADSSLDVRAHIRRLWPYLTRQPSDANENSSLIALPNPYVVPGGRFGEIYYWDSYFTQLGLMADGQKALVRDMVDNFAYLIDTLGFIPNGNRDYFLGRSQPPFFALMVKLLAQDDPAQAVNYLPQLLREHAFWMEGEAGLNQSQARHRRVVLMPNGAILNRYWDDSPAPRPESYKEDVGLAAASGRNRQKLYRDIRAACESGFDFSSRWFPDHRSLAGIHTTDIVPVDLNALLWQMEDWISQVAYAAGDTAKQSAFAHRANLRKEAVAEYLFDSESGFFVDYHLEKQAPTGVLSMAGAYPMFMGMATQGQADSAKLVLENQLLQAGGFTTTTRESGQQWDAPNGWAPMQWIGIKGLLNYGFEELAQEAAGRWIAANEEIYESKGKLVEKYNVYRPLDEAGGGEYPNQDGFGWTNGVLSKLLDMGYEAIPEAKLKSLQMEPAVVQ